MKLVDLLWEEVKNTQSIFEESLDREQFRAIILQRLQRHKGIAETKKVHKTELSNAPCNYIDLLRAIVCRWGGYHFLPLSGLLP